MFLLAISLLLVLTVNASGQHRVPGRRVDCTFIGSNEHSCYLKTLADSLRASRRVAVVAYDVVPSWYEAAQGLSKSISDQDYDSERERYFRLYVEPEIPRSYSLSASNIEFMKETSRDAIRPGVRKGALGRLTGTEKQDRDLRAQAEAVVRSWHRFQIVPDPEDADLTIEVRKYPFSRFGADEALPLALAIVWPRGADPAKDNVLWLDRFDARWRENDVVNAVMRRLHQSIEQADRMNLGHTGLNPSGQ